MRKMRTRFAARRWGNCLFLACVAMGNALGASQAEETKVTPGWDRVQTIRQAAQRIAVVHRSKGPAAAYKLIDACYRTHSLADLYTEGMEICIVQDYLQTQMVTRVIERMAPGTLARSGVQSPKELRKIMQIRIGKTLKMFDMPPTFGTEVMKLAEKHGSPVYLAVLFPEALRQHNKKESRR